MKTALKLLFPFFTMAGCASMQTSDSAHAEVDPAFASGIKQRQVLVIAHRGASGYRPEHTLAAYRLAIDMGADYIEPDLVVTKDGVLIARHENEISETTDAALKFPERKTVKRIDGKLIEGWFTEDFSLAEIRSLRAKERLSRRDHHYDGQFTVPTFAEILELLRNKTQETGRTIGVYPELKHPTYFRAQHLGLEEKLVAELDNQGFNSKASAVFVQSFEPSSLQKIRQLTPVRLIQLIDKDLTSRPYDFRASGDSRTYADLVSETGLQTIKQYADGIGPHKSWLLTVPDQAAAAAVRSTGKVALAHKLGLLVHAWTFRSDELPDYFAGQASAEYFAYYREGVDAVFSDFPDAALAVRNRTANPE